MVAREAEVAVGTIYLYYSSRDDLYLNLIAERAEQLRARYLGIFARRLEPLDELKAIASAYLDHLLESREIFLSQHSVVFSQLHERLKRKSEMRNFQRVMDLSHEIFGLWEGTIRRAFEGGVIANSMGPRKTAAVVWASMNGAFMLMGDGNFFRDVTGLNPEHFVDDALESHLAASQLTVAKEIAARVANPSADVSRKKEVKFSRGRRSTLRVIATSVRTTAKGESVMKFTWFHLMPYRFLPEDFKEKYRSVWVDIPRDLYDPKVGHRLYNDYLDQLEYADAMGFDGLGVNEHHQNAYGLMPSPNIMAAALTRRTRNANLVVLGNSIALYNPPIRVAEEFAMLDVISGGRLIAGFPVGTSMDTNFCYGEVPATIREKYYEAHDLIIKAWKAEGRFLVQRQVHQAALREPVAEADPAAASADLDSGRRLGRDLRLLRRPRLPVQLPFLLRVHRGQEGRRRLLGRDGEEGQGAESVSASASRRSSPLRRPTSRPRRTTPRTWTTSTTDACTSITASPTRRAIAR